MNWKQALEGMTPYKPGRSIEEVKETLWTERSCEACVKRKSLWLSPSVKAIFCNNMHDSIMKFIRMVTQVHYVVRLRLNMVSVEDRLVVWKWFR